MWRPFLIFNLVLICLLAAQGVYAQDEELPLVWVSANDLLYGGGKTSDGYANVFHLSYKYSSDWVLITAKTATFKDDSISYLDGTQFAFSPEGRKLSELQFSKMDETLQYSVMERASLGPDGKILTPFTGANIGYAVIQAKGGVLEQISLAKAVEELKGNLHLYDGFLYQFDENLSLKTQIAFSEISFSTQGLLRSSVEAPANIPATPNPGATPNQPSITPYSENPIKPEGGTTLFSSGNGIPTITLPTDYDVPPIKRIGIIKFIEHAHHPELVVPATEQFAKKLGEIPDLEVKIMSYDNKVLAKGLLYEKAVEQGTENSVDAFIISDLTGFSVPTPAQIGPNETEIRISCKIEFGMIDCTGGRVFWSTKADHAEFVSTVDFNNNKDRILLSVLNATIDEGLAQLKKDNVLAGGPIGKAWGSES
jgi:hypothetical protein